MKLFGINITMKTVTKLVIAAAPVVAAVRQAVRDAKVKPVE